MRYLIEHETVLEYPGAIREHHVELRLAPRCDEYQSVTSCVIETEPPAELASYNDYYLNRVDYFCVIPPHTRLVTRLRTEVETRRENPLDFIPVAAGEQQQWLQGALRRDPRMNDFILHRSAVTPQAQKLAEVLSVPLPVFDRERTVMESLMELMGWIPTVLKYRSGATVVHGDLAAAVGQGAGVCQDFAHLFITVARSWGIPARYVMGYLDAGVGSGGEQPATHAWAEAMVPGGGWIGFDTTNTLLANDRYVAVCVGRDSYDAAPQRGSFKGESGGEQPSVKVTVQELKQGQGQEQGQGQKQEQGQSQKQELGLGQEQKPKQEQRQGQKQKMKQQQ
jgi:transglutaminase-like putative cysteine protease